MLFAASYKYKCTYNYALYREPFVDFEDNFEGIDHFEEIDDLALKYMYF